PLEKELATSRIIVPETARERSMMVEVYARVVAVGPDAWLGEGTWWRRLLFGRQLRARPGEKVMVSKWCGHITYGPADAKMYRMVNAEDIFCAIDKERSKEEIEAEIDATCLTPSV